MKAVTIGFTLFAFVLLGALPPIVASFAIFILMAIWVGLWIASAPKEADVWPGGTGGDKEGTSYGGH